MFVIKIISGRDITFTFMQIGFEAKRVFQNTTGLGSYARGLIDSLCVYAPEHQYHLFAPKETDLFHIENYPNVSLHLPQTFFHKKLKSYWRSRAVTNDIEKQNLDIYHGLSAELPIGIEKLPLAKVVSVHDLIYERFPAQYNLIDVLISRKKTKHACRMADGIAAMSEQTKKDLIEYYHIPASKIHVTYQSCYEGFLNRRDDNELISVKAKYNLPETFFLYVGSIIERKGLLKICQALVTMPDKVPLMVIGRGSGHYIKKVKDFILANKLLSQVVFLNEQPQAANRDYVSGIDFPAIYQLAKALIYPSVFEGFGIPVLEGISSGIPVITSNISSMPEAGGGGALYVNPLDENEIAEAMQMILNDNHLCEKLVSNGQLHAQQFTREKIASRMIELYQSFI